MGRAKIFSLQDDVDLANSIRNYRCLYDKTYSGYGETDECLRAWREVEEKLNLDEGNAITLFTALKKRYSRKRVNVKKSFITGVGKTAAIRGLEEYDFLKWLDPYIRLRRTKFDGLDDEMDYIQPTQYYPNTNYNTHVTVLDTYENKPPRDHHTLHSMERVVEQELVTTPKMISSSTVTVPQYSRYDTVDIKNSNTVDKREDLLTERKPKFIHENIQKQCSSRDSEEIYGQMIASEIRKFPDHIKYRIKNEFQNILFKYQMSILTPYENNGVNTFTREILPTQVIPIETTRPSPYHYNPQETKKENELTQYTRERIERVDVEGPTSPQCFSDYSMVNPLKQANDDKT